MMSQETGIDIRAAVNTRLKRVERLLRAVSHDNPPAERTVHALRVATRRARSALAVVEPMLDEKAQRSAKRALKQTRRAAAEARACDVDRAWFALMLDRLVGEPPATSEARVQRSAAYAVGRLTEQRRAAVDALRQVASSGRVKRLGRMRRRVASRLGAAAADDARARDLLAQSINSAVGSARDACGAVQDAPRLEAVHEARITVKRLRYTIEFAGEALGCGQRVKPLVKGLASVQDELGRVNDAGERVARLRAWTQSEDDSMLPDGLRDDCLALIQTLERARDNALGETLAAWPAIAIDRIGAALAQAEALTDSLAQGQTPMLTETPPPQQAHDAWATADSQGETAPEPAPTGDAVEREIA